MAKYLVEIKGELPKQGALGHAVLATVSGLLDDMAGEICDSYCKYNDGSHSESELYKICETCPLNML